MYREHVCARVVLAIVLVAVLVILCLPAAP